jgi:HAD superfamily hydrolase (TIGR01509 family)
MIRAWIFDFDDTLVSSAPVWERAERDLYRAIGGRFDTEYAETYKGLNAMDVARKIWERVAPADRTAEACGALLRDMLIDLAASESLEMDGASQILSATSRMFDVAIASGSPREVLEVVIDRFGWRDYVRLCVSSEEVPTGKPAPDVFLETSRRLGVLPDECIVVEDSVHGATGARAAGMACIGVGARRTDDALCEVANWCVPDLKAIDPAAYASEPDFTTR